MLNCIKPADSQRVQDLQKKSGLSDFSLKSQIRHYTTRHNDRLPELDELVGANSEPYLREQLKLAKGKSGKTLDLLNFTHTKSFKDAIIQLNNIYRDLEITGELFNNLDYSLKIKHRPTVQEYNGTDKNVITVTKEDRNFMNATLDKLADLYGIKIIEVTNDDIHNDPELKTLVGVDKVHGFIYKGNIYINKSNNSPDTKLHEMLHLIFGSVKYQNRLLYDNLMQLAFSQDMARGFNQFINDQRKLGDNRTMGDLAEEFMVTQLARYFTNPASGSWINNLSSDMKYQVMYNMNRLLDSVFMGDVSVKAVTNLYKYSFKDIARLVNSSILTNKYQGSLTDAYISRIAANLKALYIKNNRLTENCE